MTRLTETHIRHTKEHLKRIDVELSACVRTGLRGVALRTLGIEGDPAIAPPAGQNLAVVPITAGEGIIHGFAETVCAISRHIGLNARCTSGSDVSGIVEAYESGVDIIVMADDNRFMAVNTRTRSIADNDRATGEGFAVLLDLMTEGIAGQSCGVIGCGPVGSAAALRMAKMGAKLTLCDLDEDRARRLACRIRVRIGGEVRVQELNDLLAECNCIVDATPSTGIIPASAIKENRVIVAPGVPHGLTEEAHARIGRRFYHDDLPLGVAVMVLAAAFDRLTDKPGCEDERRMNRLEGCYS